LSITFSINQSVNTPRVLVDGNQVTVTGSGSGPYNVTYNIQDNHMVPLPISISFTNPSGTGGQSYFWIGNSATLPVRASDSSSAETVSGQTFYRQLGLNSKGSDVSALQTRLKKDGYYSGPITGTFGPLTQVAVKKYQSAHGLKQAGVVGPATQSLLNQGK
ncbi:MAG: peptidoglycan-binding domain-containing protein, partial [Candidatus Taylorbacteria bacterium]